MNNTWYPMPGINDTSSLFNFFSFINNGAGGLFFPLMLLGIWVVIFISSLASSMRFNSASRAFTFANFFCGVLAAILAILNLLNKKFLYLLIFLFGFGIVWMMLQDSRD